MPTKRRIITICLLTVSLVAMGSVVSSCGPGQSLGSILTPAPTATLAPTKGPTGKICGKVYIKEDAIASAEVTLVYRTPDEASIEVTTDTEGNFCDNAPVGEYGIELSVTTPMFVSLENMALRISKNEEKIFPPDDYGGEGQIAIISGKSDTGGGIYIVMLIGDSFTFTVDEGDDISMSIRLLP